MPDPTDWMGTLDRNSGQSIGPGGTTPAKTAIVMDQRMYQLIQQQGPIVDRKFEIEFLASGVETFVFTFG